jgi:replication factor A1
MEIKDLKPNSGNVDLVLEVVDKEEPRSFEKFGKEGRVCNVKAKDGSGEVKMTLWNEDVDKVNAGDKIHLQNGWCSEFKGEVQISSGKFGKIEVVGQGSPEVLTNDPSLLNPDAAAEEGDVDVIDEEESVE